MFEYIKWYLLLLNTDLFQKFYFEVNDLIFNLMTCEMLTHTLAEI